MDDKVLLTGRENTVVEGTLKWRLMPETDCFKSKKKILPVSPFT